jgi:hypothetical protein
VEAQAVQGMQESGLAKLLLDVASLAPQSNARYVNNSQMGQTTQLTQPDIFNSTEQKKAEPIRVLAQSVSGLQKVLEHSK